MSVGKSLADLWVNIKANTSGLSKGLGAAKGIIGSSMGGIVGIATGVGAAFAGAFAVKSMLDAAIEGERAQAGLASALKATGQSAAEIMPRFEQLAKEVQAVTTVGDEALYDLLKLGTNLGIPADKLDTMAKSAIGLSRSLGIDAKDAMSGLAKESLGFKSKLEKSIPALKGVTDQTQRLAILSQMAGQGYQQEQDAAQTVGGSLSQLWNAIGDLAELLGNTFAPVIQYAAQGITSMSRTLESSLGPAIGAAQEFLMSIAKTIGDFINTALFMAANWDLVIEEIGISLADFGIGVSDRFTFVIDTITSFGSWLYDEFGNIFATAGDYAVTILSNFIGNTQTVFTELMGFVSSLGSWLYENFGDVWMTSFDYAMTMLANFGQNVRTFFSELWGWIKSGGTDSIDLSGLKGITDGANNYIQKAFVPDKIDLSGLKPLTEGATNYISKAFKPPDFKDSFDKAEARAIAGLDKRWDEAQQKWQGDGEKDVFAPGDLSVTQAKKEKDKKEGEDVGKFQSLGSAFNNYQSQLAKAAEERDKDKLAEAKQTNKYLKTIAEKPATAGGLA